MIFYLNLPLTVYSLPDFIQGSLNRPPSPSSSLQVHRSAGLVPWDPKRGKV